MTPTPNTSFSSITPKQIRVIGVPLDLGQSRRGVDMGPSAVRVADNNRPGSNTWIDVPGGCPPCTVSSTRRATFV